MATPDTDSVDPNTAAPLAVNPPVTPKPPAVMLTLELSVETPLTTTDELNVAPPVTPSPPAVIFTLEARVATPATDKVEPSIVAPDTPSPVPNLALPETPKPPTTINPPDVEDVESVLCKIFTEDAPYVKFVAPITAVPVFK